MKTYQCQTARERLVSKVSCCATCHFEGAEKSGLDYNIDGISVVICCGIMQAIDAEHRYVLSTESSSRESQVARIKPDALLE